MGRHRRPYKYYRFSREVCMEHDDGRWLWFGHRRITGRFLGAVLYEPGFAEPKHLSEEAALAYLEAEGARRRRRDGDNLDALLDGEGAGHPGKNPG